MIVVMEEGIGEELVAATIGALRAMGLAVHREGALPIPEYYDSTFRLIHDISTALRKG